VTETGPKPPVHIFPDRFDAEIATASEIRHRGIFNVPVYTAEAEIAVSFRLPDPAEVLGAGDRLLWDETEFHLSLTSNRALRGVAELLVDGRPAALEPRAEAREVGGIFAVVGDPRDVEGYGLSLGFNGAQSLFVAPVGRDSHVTLSSDWPHPSFWWRLPARQHPRSRRPGSPRSGRSRISPARLPQIARQDFDNAARAEAFGVRFFRAQRFLPEGLSRGALRYPLYRAHLPDGAA
jgi:inner membrane protein